MSNIYLKGKVKFIHAGELNKYNKWSVTLYLDKDGIEKIRELQAEGLRNVIKRDDDGDYISFHRDPSNPRAHTPPKCIDAEGKPIDGSTIGWNSDVEVSLDVYKSGPKSQYKYVAIRWEGVKVHNLVPYMPTAKQMETKEVEPW